MIKLSKNNFNLHQEIIIIGTEENVAYFGRDYVPEGLTTTIVPHYKEVIMA